MFDTEMEWRERTIIVRWSYYPGTDDTWEEPGECEDLDIDKAVWVNDDGTETDLTREEVDALVKDGWKHDWWTPEPDVEPPDHRYMTAYGWGW